MPYWRLFYHFVWTTKNREPIITADIEVSVYQCLRADANRMYAPFIVVGGIEDHVHVVSAIRPAVSPAEFVKQLKGSSSHFVTHQLKRAFEWQVGYGVFSVSEHELPSVINYVKHQKQHHADSNLIDVWEREHHWNIGPDIESFDVMFDQ